MFKGAKPGFPPEPIHLFMLSEGLFNRCAATGSLSVNYPLAEARALGFAVGTHGVFFGVDPCSQGSVTQSVKLFLETILQKIPGLGDV